MSNNIFRNKAPMNSFCIIWAIIFLSGCVANQIPSKQIPQYDHLNKNYKDLIYNYSIPEIDGYILAHYSNLPEPIREIFLKFAKGHAFSLYNEKHGIYLLFEINSGKKISETDELFDLSQISTYSTHELDKKLTAIFRDKSKYSSMYCSNSRYAIKKTFIIFNSDLVYQFIEFHIGFTLSRRKVSDNNIQDSYGIMISRISNKEKAIEDFHRFIEGISFQNDFRPRHNASSWVDGHKQSGLSNKFDGKWEFNSKNQFYMFFNINNGKIIGKMGNISWPQDIHLPIRGTVSQDGEFKFEHAGHLDVSIGYDLEVTDSSEKAGFIKGYAYDNFNKRYDWTVYRK